MKKIVLVDGSSYLFRAFHAMPNFVSKDGEPTGAILGVINMLKKLPEMYKTEYVAVIFDPKGKNFRHDMYPEYKANRKPMDDDLRVQIEPLHDIIKKLGFPLIIENGVEADDVIGTLAVDLEKQGCQVVISTGDKDMAQLVNESVVLYDSMKNVTTDIPKVLEKFQVKPSQIIDYLALMGDASDNIPGVPKVGPKTAVKWLQEYNDIEGVIANQDKIGGKVGENLRNSTDVLRLSYELATIKCDIELNLLADDLKMNAPDNNALRPIFSRYGFKSLLNGLGETSTAPVSEINIVVTPEVFTKDIAIDYRTITTAAELSELVVDLNKSKGFAFDTETDSLDTSVANLVGMSFCMSEGTACYIPLQHMYLGVPQQLELKVVLEALSPIFADTSKIKIAHNFKFDEKVLSRYGVKVVGNIQDTMIMSYIIKSSGKHSMDSLANEYLGVETIAYADLVGSGRKKQTIDMIDVDIVSKYASEDADITFRLFNHFEAILKQIPELNKLYSDVEMPMTLILNDMEKMGVKIDAEKLMNQSIHLQEKISQIQSKCFEICGKEFNLSSPLQLRTILFEEMELPIVKKTAKGQASTSEEVLVQLAEEFEIAALIMEYRHLSKLKNTYTDKLPKLIDANSRVHTSYNQTGTITGRLSSSEPNLQNIPVRSPEGRKIREAFVAEEGCIVLAADYSQVELRIMAHLSKDENLIEAFNNSVDIHSSTAAEVMGLNIDDVTSEQRRNAKAINFGLIYGMSAFGLSKQLDIPRAEAQDYINMYFNRYPSIKEYMETAKEFAKVNGYVETILGRRVYLPEIFAKNGIQRKAAERAAINAPMQGTASDIIKKAMITIKKDVCDMYPNDVKMVMQVHDELVFEVSIDKASEISAKIKSIMENAVLLDVPLEVNIDSGENWNQAH